MSSVKNAVQLLLLSVGFGGAVMHSYVVSPIAFKEMSREEFGKLQAKVFPLYFSGQTAIPLLLGLTTPIAIHCAGPVLAVSALSGAFNLFYALPKCKQIKEERNKLVAEKRHERVVDGNTEVTEEMAALNKQFGMYHGLSSLSNLVSIVSLGVYGYVLSKRIRI